MAQPRRIAVCSWSLQPADPAGLVAALGRVGIEAVQLALVPVVEEPDAWGDAPARLRDAGIEIVSGMLATVGEDYTSLASIAATGGVRPDGTWSATLDRARRVAARAADDGIRLVTFHAGFIPHDAGSSERHMLLARLRTIVDLFADHGVATAFETGQETAETLLEALHELDRDVGVNFDPANMILYGMGDPVVALHRLAPWVRQVHVKDALPAREPGAWGTEVPVGEGAVAWRAFFRALAEIDRPLDLVIEREAGDRREADVALARERVGEWVG